MEKILFNPFFGIVLSMLCFQIGIRIMNKTKSLFANPLLIGIVLSIAFLKVFGIPYEAYKQGGDILKMLISPVEAVIIGVALHEQLQILKKNWFPIIVSTVLGSAIAVLSVGFLGKLGGLPVDVCHAMLPKSVTTAIALDIGFKLGWEGSLITMMTVITGVTGAVIAPFVCKFIKSPVARGLAIGTTSHSVGTAKAIEMGEVEGAMSGLALSLAAISTSFLIPLFIMLFNI